MRDRRTARVVLLDPDDRILLLKGRLPGDADGPAFWYTVGGGLEEGESLQEAAAREVIEETGFTDVVLGAVLWYDEVILPDIQLEARLFKQHYILARTAGGDPSRAGWQDYEHELSHDIRWWTLAEIQGSADTFYPIGLGELLSDALAGRVAAPPLVVATPDGPVRPVPRPA